jgi:hypothetical protein
MKFDELKRTIDARQSEGFDAARLPAVPPALLRVPGDRVRSRARIDRVQQRR